MEIIQAPNQYHQNDNKDRIFIYLAGSVKQELIEYIKNNISNYSLKYMNKIVFFDSTFNLENKTEEEIKAYYKWENEYIKNSDIFALLLDNNENNKSYYQLGAYLSFFYDIYKMNINQHFILAYTKESKNELFIKTQVVLLVKNLINPILINDISSYGDIILKKLNELYQATDTFIDHNVIHTEEEHYWSINLGPNIKKIFCRAPWPQSQFSIGIIGIYGIGKSCIYRWICEGRFCKIYDNYIGGNSYLYQVEINNKKFIVNFEDTGSQERFSCDILVNGLKKKSCILFVFDITNRKSFEEIKNNIYPKLIGLNNNNIFNILIGSKLDLKHERNIAYGEAEEFAEEHNLKYFEVSTKTGENMERLCNYIYNKFSKL